MRQLGKRSVLDFLEALSPEDLQVISAHIGEEVISKPLDYHIVKETKMCCKNAAHILNEMDCYANFAITRHEEEITVCFWR
jgi:hypothetical protein